MNHDLSNFFLHLVFVPADGLDGVLEKGNLVWQDVPVVKPSPIEWDSLIET